MIDHLGIGVSDIARSKQFFTDALKPLGIGMLMDFGDGAGFGYDGKPFFWIGTSTKLSAAHVAFVAKDRQTVDAFHMAALSAGGRDNGAPGVRAHYHPNYYGAFIFDLDGNNIEAVCHVPVGALAAMTSRPTAKKTVKKTAKKAAPKKVMVKKAAKKAAKKAVKKPAKKAGKAKRRR